MLNQLKDFTEQLKYEMAIKDETEAVEVCDSILEKIEELEQEATP